MNLRFIDWIWHIRGSLEIAPEQSSDEAFGRLMPLFCQRGTTHERARDTLIFRKKDQAAQDKMSVFDGGLLRIDTGPAGRTLRYHLTSRALLFCFLAPLLFLAFGQLTVALGKLDRPAAASAGKSKKAAAAAKKPAKPDVQIPMNPIDKALGAPAPDKPKKGGAGDDGDKGKFSPTSAYVFAGIFAVLYVVGRILEDRLIRALFRKSLRAENAHQSSDGSLDLPQLVQ